MAPQVAQACGEVRDVGVGVIRRRCDPKTLCANRHGRIVDRLNIDAIGLKQNIRDPFALSRIAHHHRHNVARVFHVEVQNDT